MKMKSLSLALMSAACIALPSVVASAEDAQLASLRWKARPVVVLADTPDDPRVAQQIGSLDRAKAAVEDRAIKVLQETEQHGALHRQLGLTPQGFAVVLVGKDGDVKKVWHEPVDPKRIFAIIDQMPRRREEMMQREELKQ